MAEVVADPQPGDAINTALVAFTGCIGDAIPDICSYGLTIGDTYVPFDPDEGECEDDDVACSQIWVRVESVTPVGSDSWEGDCATVMRIELEVGVLRCLEIPDKGEAPTTSQVLFAAVQAMSDMNAIYCAAMDCEVWNSVESGTWFPMGPMGGQYGGSWSFTVEI